MSEKNLASYFKSKADIYSLTFAMVNSTPSYVYQRTENISIKSLGIKCLYNMFIHSRPEVVITQMFINWKIDKQTEYNHKIKFHLFIRKNELLLQHQQHG